MGSIDSRGIKSIVQDKLEVASNILQIRPTLTHEARRRRRSREGESKREKVGLGECGSGDWSQRTHPSIEATIYNKQWRSDEISWKENRYL